MPGSLASTEPINSKVGKSLSLLLRILREKKIKSVNLAVSSMNEGSELCGQDKFCLITTQSIQSSRQNRPSPALPFESIQDEIDLIKAESVDRS